MADREALTRESQRELVVLRDLRMTCSACPSQWEGITEGGECFYARYRWGHLTWGFGASLNAAVDASIRGPALNLGDDLDGELATSTMLHHVGATLDRTHG